MNKEELLNKLKDTTIYQEYLKLESVYKDLDEKQEIFCEAFDVHCKKGCGTCCEHFIPDIYNVEARFLALGVILDNRVEEVKEKIEAFSPNQEHCPLYDFDSDYHCTVYQYRPLICRLFGATASSNKNGCACFRHCKYNVGAKDLNSDELALKKDKVIHMSDYGLKIEELALGEKEKMLLPYALSKAIDEILYILELLSNA